MWGGGRKGNEKCVPERVPARSNWGLTLLGFFWKPGWHTLQNRSLPQGARTPRCLFTITTPHCLRTVSSRERLTKQAPQPDTLQKTDTEHGQQPPGDCQCGLKGSSKCLCILSHCVHINIHVQATHTLTLTRIHTIILTSSCAHTHTCAHILTVLRPLPTSVLCS